MESILFVLFIVAGSASSLIVLSLIAIGLIIKSKTLKIIGISLSIVPILCFGSLYSYYSILNPYWNQNDMKEYSGTYFLDDRTRSLLSNKYSQPENIQITLTDDGNFRSSAIVEISLSESGSWKTGSIDGMIQLNVDSGSIFARPDYQGTKPTLSFESFNNNDDFLDIRSIIFVKKSP